MNWNSFQYTDTASAEACRNRLHNCIWPPNIGRALRVDYSTQDLYEKHVNPPPARTTAVIATGGGEKRAREVDDDEVSAC